ncbi:hypothetical protein D1605_011165 [Xylella fastidiosa subsp. fastidiosa]|uniref:DUF4348 domain-containing protein n=3 Tax=Xylella fastidiosa TaxID=2371 RepID=Q879V1_XYLFT|nr:hypothetical protein [Xylella fastidiosa]ADN62961.1 hypothetical protein XFLM_05015 [Xylella fastidiosa subsp. fastidiosa GB514]KAF0571547.1 hypothetical protein P305_03880 [Xylella fastidiosa subsp. fastidiosa Mus-1]AAO29912.1 conserved hypothetical protein [Xylella fastidiosa Temecula1]ACB93591.1 conserved hypothetical protein [Xylella fastidiosa M23]KGM19524.1 hypothetical protein JT24_11670 [Xylella fastidiosa]
MKRVLKLFIGSVFFMAYTVAAVTPDTQKNQSHATTTPSVPCPGKDFPSFLEKFSNDVTIQRAFTTYPLIKHQYDITAQPEPKEFIQILQREQIEFPVMPLSQERSRIPLDIEVIKLTSNKAQVRVVKPDTDYQISYFFKKKGCWKLVEIDNHSF